MPQGTCRVCGCTQARACTGGCYWVSEDLCSACHHAMPPFDRRERDGAIGLEARRAAHDGFCRVAAIVIPHTAASAAVMKRIAAETDVALLYRALEICLGDWRRSALRRRIGELARAVQ